ncbi:cytochrome P450 [Infundibulicybe gibba]|nr:cytochrome P450 [Infundibulicybe gibba]
MLNISTSIILLSSITLLVFIRKVVAFWQAIWSIQNQPGYRTIFYQAGAIGNILPPIRGIAPGRNHPFINKHKVRLAGIFMGRKISAPAFSERNNKLVWDETVKIMNGLFDNVWGKQEQVTTDNCVEITLPIALFVIGAAGFGRSISWEEDSTIPPGHKLSFKDALHIVSTGVMTKIIVWYTTGEVLLLSELLSNLQRYMSEMIRDRQTSEKVERFDLFSSLLDANNEDGDDSALTESELIGNIFIFLLAGHETTAHTLCFTFGMLALYQDEQEWLYQHIRSVIPGGRIPVTSIPKYSAEDTTLVAGNQHGEQKTIPVPKGTVLVIDTPGLHYNRTHTRYWKDPHAFRPSRFLGDWPRDAFVPFSVGARACLGRRISVKEEAQFANETFEARKDRILRARPGLTLT